MLKLILATGLFALSANTLVAEPWLSNRYAQNCAGCHAPGRKNLEMADRRCTLACQGCHVNPNGGGMRNFYGKWNEDRWLYSVKSDLLAKKKRPAPFKRQKYASAGAKKGKEAAESNADKKSKKNIRRSKRKLTTIPEGTPNLVEAYKDLPESEYDRSDGTEQITAKSYEDFLDHVPVEDPIYQKQMSKVDGGADLRWQMVRGTTSTSIDGGDETETKTWANFLMNADVGLRWRPVYKRYQFVYEGRYLGNPTVNKTEQVAQTMQRRSMYFMADDLPFATYVMGGYYRPLFGNYTADHTTLAQKMQSYALQDTPQIYGLNYEAYSMGGSPNVPFLNLHYIGRQFGAAANDSHKGWAMNLGGRWVTLGASFNYSFWSSEKDETVGGESINTRLQMHSVSGGLMFWRLISNIELVALSKDRPNDAFSKGVVATFDNYLRMWREMYLTVSYAQGNISENLRPGSSSQVRIGWRAFITQGVDAMLLYNLETSEVTDANNDSIPPSETTTSEILWQLHLYI